MKIYLVIRGVWAEGERVVEVHTKGPDAARERAEELFTAEDKDDVYYRAEAWSATPKKPGLAPTPIVEVKSAALEELEKSCEETAQQVDASLGAAAPSGAIYEAGKMPKSPPPPPKTPVAKAANGGVPDGWVLLQEAKVPEVPPEVVAALGGPCGPVAEEVEA